MTGPLALIIPALLQAAPLSAANANACVVPTSDGGAIVAPLRNRCDYRVVAYMCVVGPPRRDTHLFFDCAKGQVGSYDLKPGGEAPAIYRGARRIHWFACRFPEYLPRQVQYRAGKGLTGRCE
ncbi:hypothetical protein OK349_01125 [Sphingomonas sp. BT-65]|uniref:hypothetical protein n=1 Tax=Sphingomonas sp. BT-65 TaxID=2989821 RepID=UPI0022367175|nr:hypothetical protein [Sphingomonas sp. BT-65]MCW4460294.1 hypothetical protein [Sphingomonas sp. BT-65]